MFGAKYGTKFGTKLRRGIAAFSMLLCACVVHADPVTVEVASVLRAEPRADAAAVGEVVRGAAGNALERKDAWVRIQAGALTGWLYSFNVRFGGNSSAGGAGGALGRLFGQRQRISVTSTIGIRGLDDEDLKQARFDAGQIGRLDGFAATQEAAQAHAGQAGLEAGPLEYLQSAQQPAETAGASEPAGAP